MGRISESDYQLMMMRLDAGKKRDTASIGEPEPLESPFQDKIREYFEGKGYWILWSRMDMATTTPKGTPDMIVFADHGRVLIIEAKARDEKLKPAQMGVKLKLESLGHTVHVCRNMEEVIAAESTHGKLL